MGMATNPSQSGWSMMSQIGAQTGSDMIIGLRCGTTIGSPRS